MVALAVLGDFALGLLMVVGKVVEGSNVRHVLQHREVAAQAVTLGMVGEEISHQLVLRQPQEAAVVAEGDLVEYQVVAGAVLDCLGKAQTALLAAGAVLAAGLRLTLTAVLTEAAAALTMPV